VGFEVGIEASDWRPTATVGFFTDVAVLTDTAAAATIGGDTAVVRPVFELETEKDGSGVLVE
jgi:hypothetical protein